MVPLLAGAEWFWWDIPSADSLPSRFGGGEGEREREKRERERESILVLVIM